jgi:hypothetical protein
VFDAGLLAGLQEAAGRAGIVAVVLQRIGDGLGNDGVRCEVHHRIDAALAQQAADELAIAGVADHQLAVHDCRPEAGGKVVEHDYCLITLAELANDMAADIPGAAGYENCHDE